jgi:ATP diphosphatase
MPYKIDDLLDIMACLRDPGKGCPWDQRQTWDSIVPYTLEEAYEVADAIENRTFSELRKELGDLLFQVVFYAQMGKEQGVFDFQDIVESACEKMIRRHPHVFAGRQVENEVELKAAWEKEKQRERKKSGMRSGVLAGVAKTLPALVRADKLQKRAAQAGFDWPDMIAAMAKAEDKLHKMREAVKTSDPQATEEGIGDLLFSVVSIARLLNIDAEQALRSGNKKFEKRFQSMEQLLHAQGTDSAALDTEQWKNTWRQIMDLEKSDD